MKMTAGTKQIITVTGANQNFSKAMQIADEYGNAVVFKNNRPQYKLVNLDKEPDFDFELTDDEKIDIVAARVLARYKAAFLELAK